MIVSTKARDSEVEPGLDGGDPGIPATDSGGSKPSLKAKPTPPPCVSVVTSSATTDSSKLTRGSTISSGHSHLTPEPNNIPANAGDDIEISFSELFGRWFSSSGESIQSDPDPDVLPYAHAPLVDYESELEPPATVPLRSRTCHPQAAQLIYSPTAHYKTSLCPLPLQTLPDISRASLAVTYHSFNTIASTTRLPPSSYLPTMNIFRIINEPTAAGIAYGLDKKVTGERNQNKKDLSANPGPHDYWNMQICLA
ncbi:hypothetical protein AZE42_07478 [Rhizopogon vesiculosus]|uniref:Uncharacterized protein n=1 Tax=Rhizopogon vesiculosus TaxID=180088 RepID=A0A1J8Q6P1_9AGAM|nr:hypothetical protein AZE42_07478 [Rhizopogon vesiculosus]